MIGELQRELEAAIRSGKALEEIVALLRRHKTAGVTQEQMYAVLQSLRETVADEALEDRILEVADFVAGFCSPHMKVWNT